jgi:hypothetical protein
MAHFRRNSRDPVLRGATRAALLFGFPHSILPCRWLRARSAGASLSWSKPGPWRLLFARSLTPSSPSPVTPAISSPLMRFRTLQRVKPRAATVTRYLRFLRYLPLAGIASPDSAPSSDFLSLLTSCSARSPSSLVSCWMHSWVFTFEGFPSPVAVPLFVTQWSAPLPVHRSSSRHASILADTHPATSSEDSIAPTPVQGFKHPVSPWPRLVLPRTRDSCLPWRLPPRGFIPRSRPAIFSDAAKRRPLSRRPSLMGLV